MHVRDLDPVDDPEAGAEGEHAARLVGVDVDLQRLGVADDEERVAELLELALDRVAVEVLSLDHERRAVAIAGELLVDRLDPELPRPRHRLGQRLAGHDRGEAADDLQETGAPRVDDTGVAQHLELLRCAIDRLLTAADEHLQELGVRDPVDRCLLTLFGHLADDRQHRPLDRLPHRAIRGIARRAERARHDRGVDLAVGAERLGRAAHDLREDHARVPARAHQGRPGHFLHQPGPIVRRRAVELVDDRPCRQRQVRAGVAVGNGIHVEVVDAAAAALERVERAPGQLLHEREVAHALELFTSWIRTSTSATRSPVRRSTS